MITRPQRFLMSNYAESCKLTPMSKLKLLPIVTISMICTTTIDILKGRLHNRVVASPSTFHPKDDLHKIWPICQSFLMGVNRSATSKTHSPTSMPLTVCLHCAHCLHSYSTIPSSQLHVLFAVNDFCTLM